MSSFIRIEDNVKKSTPSIYKTFCRTTTAVHLLFAYIIIFDASRDQQFLQMKERIINIINKIINKNGFIVLDGSQGTEAEKYGVKYRNSLWSSQLIIDDPKLIKKIHQSYLEAGSDVITTFSYQASIPGFAREGYSDKEAMIFLNSSIDIAKGAVDDFLEHQKELCNKSIIPGSSSLCPLIAFSCGSYGAFLADGSEFTGSYLKSIPDSTIYNYYKDKLDAVRENHNFEIIAFETIPGLKEALIIAELLAVEKYDKAVWISFSCQNEELTHAGDRFVDDVLPAIETARRRFGLVNTLLAVGVNCTSPVFTRELLRKAHHWIQDKNFLEGRVDEKQCSLGEGGTQMTSDHIPPLLLVAYPNSGEEWDSVQRCYVGLNPSAVRESERKGNSPEERFSSVAEELVNICGVKIVGGCCRIGCEHIRAVKKRLSRKSNSLPLFNKP